MVPNIDRFAKGGVSSSLSCLDGLAEIRGKREEERLYRTRSGRIMVGASIVLVGFASIDSIITYKGRCAMKPGHKGITVS